VVPTFDAADREGVCSKLARAFRGSTETARQMIRERSEPQAFFESTAKQPLSKFNAS